MASLRLVEKEGGSLEWVPRTFSREVELCCLTSCPHWPSSPARAVLDQLGSLAPRKSPVQWLFRARRDLHQHQPVKGLSRSLPSPHQLSLSGDSWAPWPPSFNIPRRSSLSRRSWCNLQRVPTVSPPPLPVHSAGAMCDRSSVLLCLDCRMCASST